NGSISYLQKNCSYKFHNPKDKQQCIMQHYKNYYNDNFLKLKVLNAKPYKKPLMQNVITLTKEEQLIQPIYITKLL
ncbi:9754_t:CDS:1, partial [Gigaspora margarita]